MYTIRMYSSFNIFNKMLPKKFNNLNEAKKELKFLYQYTKLIQIALLIEFNNNIENYTNILVYIFSIQYKIENKSDKNNIKYMNNKYPEINF